MISKNQIVLCDELSSQYNVQVPDSEIGLGYYVVYIVLWNSHVFLSGPFNPLGLYRDVTKLLKGITSFLQLFHYFPTAFFTTMLGERYAYFRTQRIV